MSSLPEDGSENRVRCLYCGANNFPSSPTCWQCVRPLQTLRSGTPPSEQGPRRREPLPQASIAYSNETDPVSPALAAKVAAALGLMFPYIGLPVGMVFLMLDDARKTRIGWITIGWSVAGSVISAILLLATLGPMLAILKTFLPHTAPGGLPSLPTPSGESGDLNVILPQLRLFLAE